MSKIHIIYTKGIIYTVRENEKESKISHSQKSTLHTVSLCTHHITLFQKYNIEVHINFLFRLLESTQENQIISSGMKQLCRLLS
jgi:hypothetical protein